MMAKEECYEISITVYSYKKVVDEFKKKNNLSNEDVIDKLENELQMQAWADAYLSIQETLDWENSPEGKKFIEEQEAKESLASKGEGL